MPAGSLSANCLVEREGRLIGLQMRTVQSVGCACLTVCLALASLLCAVWWSRTCLSCGITHIQVPL